MADRRYRVDHKLDARIRINRVSIIARYDFQGRRWMHSPGVVLSATEAAVLASLPHGAKNTEIARAVCLSESRVEKIIADLKDKFHTSGCPGVSRRELMRIGNDLFL